MTTELKQSTGRLPIFTEQLLIRLSPEMRESIGKTSRVVGQTANEFVREAVRLHLAGYNKPLRKR